MLDLLYAEAVLGRDAEEFFSTELGRYITGRCDQEIADAQDELSRVFPWRKRRIQELQNRVWRAKAVQDWLGELIANGKAAEVALEEQG